MGRVEGKVALITGGSMGLGQATAIRLAEEGASVIITDLVDDEGEASAEKINATGGTAIFLHHDVTQEAEWKDIVSQVMEKFSRLDILVNNAGIAIGGAITEMSLEDFHKQNAVNLDGVFLGLKHCIPEIAKSGGGSIINISSVAGFKSAPGLAAYAMTKGGVRLLSKSVAIECAREGNGVRVNSVHPGIIDTPIWDKLGAEAIGENRTMIAESAALIIPGGVVGQPINIANGVLFLASDESSYVNGTELVIDNGFIA